MELKEIKRKKEEEIKKSREIIEMEIKRKNEKEKQKKEEESKKQILIEEIEKKKKEQKIIVQKMKEMIKKKEIKNKIREEKKAELIKQISMDLKQKKLEFRNELEMRRKEFEKINKQKEEEEKRIIIEKEEKIKHIIEDMKKKANEEKEIELKEENLDNEGKHKYRLVLLNKLVNQYLDLYKSKDINQILEIINKIGEIFKREINYTKEYCKDNFIYVCDAIDNEDITINFLGILGEEFRQYGIYSIIERKSEDSNLMEGIFKVLLSLYSILPKYEIKVVSKSLKRKFSEQPKLWLEYCDNFKTKICNDYNIPNINFYIISNNIDLFEFTVVILDRPCINLKRYENTFNMICRNETLLNHVKLSSDFFEVKFNRDKHSWGNSKRKRGGEKYSPPFGWKGFALKVLNKFDNGDNSWIGNEGKDGEWTIAYHGIGKGNEFKKLINIILNNLKNGPGQLYANLPNIRDNNNSLVGIGVYLAPDIKEAERYSEKINLGKRKNKFQFIIMCRVKPDKIREPGRYPFNWIVDDNYDCLRPYRILVKESKR